MRFKILDEPLAAKVKDALGKNASLGTEIVMDPATTEFVDGRENGNDSGETERTIKAIRSVPSHYFII